MSRNWIGIFTGRHTVQILKFREDALTEEEWDCIKYWLSSGHDLWTILSSSPIYSHHTPYEDLNPETQKHRLLAYKLGLLERWQVPLGSQVCFVPAGHTRESGLHMTGEGDYGVFMVRFYW